MISIRRSPRPVEPHDLPRSDAPVRQIAHVQRLVLEAQPERLSQAELHQFIDDLQLHLAEVHNQIAATYFAPGVPGAASSR